MREIRPRFCVHRRRGLCCVRTIRRARTSYLRSHRRHSASRYYTPTPKTQRSIHLFRLRHQTQQQKQQQQQQHIISDTNRRQHRETTVSQSPCQRLRNRPTPRGKPTRSAAQDQKPSTAEEAAPAESTPGAEPFVARPLSRPWNKSPPHMRRRPPHQRGIDQSSRPLVPRLSRSAHCPGLGNTALHIRGGVHHIRGG